MKRTLEQVLQLVRERDRAVRDLSDARRELREEQDAHAETCRALSVAEGCVNRAEEELSERAEDSRNRHAEHMTACRQYETEIDNLRHQLDRLRADLQRAQAQLQASRVQVESLRADLHRAQARLATLSPEQQPHPDLPEVPGHVWMSRDDRWRLYRQEGAEVVGYVYQANVGRWLLDGRSEADHEYATLSAAAATLAARVMGGGG